MAIILYRRRAPVVTVTSQVSARRFMWGRSVFRRLRARYDVPPQDRAYPSDTRPAVITASPGGHPIPPSERCDGLGR